jgi:radical SAM protein with 4Fe4S-binding SPASM domain
LIENRPAIVHHPPAMEPRERKAYPKDQFGARDLFNLMFQSRLDFFAEGKVWHVHSIPPKKKWNLLKAGADHLIHGARTWSQPTGLMIEPTDLCNLDCTGCWTNDATHQGHARHLSLPHFQRIVDELGDYLTIIWLWGWGEPFLNKNIYEMIRMARRKDIVVISSTNGNVSWGDRDFEELVNCGLSQLIVAVDGLDEATYSKYRINGKLDKVLENIRRLVDTKKRLGKTSPIINMRMLVMRHNQDQTDRFLELGKTLGVDIVSYKTLCDYRKGGKNPDFPTIEKFQRYSMNETSDQVMTVPRPFYCFRPWRRAEVFADGAITPCEFDLDRQFLLGHLDDQRPLTEIFNNPVMCEFRRQFLKEIDRIPFCGNCPYKNQVTWDPTVEWQWLTDAARG